MDQQQLKQLVARAAIEEIRSDLTKDAIIGVGTGTTADLFIDLLGQLDVPFQGAVVSSQRSAARLAQYGVRIFELNDVEQLPVYVDGADEINAGLSMIKGGGGALTREKIVAAGARRFVCIADASKLVATLGPFGVPVEIIPMARRLVTQHLTALGRRFGDPEVTLRLDVTGAPLVTDNGNHILDLRGLLVDQPLVLEEEIDGVVGVVCNGLFARRGADVLLLAGTKGVDRVSRDA